MTEVPKEWQTYTMFSCPQCGYELSESSLNSYVKFSEYHQCEREFMKCINCKTENLVPEW
jgi:predicted RNA-binding Zn-ribbon protein involved in translation (DUF1610 family)